MPDTERTFTVNQPPTVVQEYLQDFGRATEWDPGTESCTRTDSGPIAVGATWHNVSKIAGRTTELEYRLDRLDPGHIVFIGTNKTATSTDDITLSPVGAGTEINYRSHIEFHGLAKVAGPLMDPILERLGNKTQDNLVRILNAL
jgi:carbon monoxide dehydrogenase subunit G